MPFTVQIALGAVAVVVVIGSYLGWESRQLDKADAADDRKAEAAAQERAARG